MGQEKYLWHKRWSLWCALVQEKMWYRWVFVPVVLVCVALVLVMRHIVSVDFTFTILTYPHESIVATQGSQPLLQGDVARGTFIAEEDNLGLVSVRFHTFERENDDILMFRLKEKGASQWQEQILIRTTFSNDHFYNFGFALIPHSQGKTYVFEIESTRGTPENAVAISTIVPNVQSKYQVPKSEITQNPGVFARYLLRKSENVMQNNNVAFPFMVFFTPFVLYIMWLFKEKIPSYPHIMFVIVASLIVADIFLVRVFVDDVLIVLMALWYWVMNVNRYKFEISYYVALVVIGLSALFNELRLLMLTERMMSWAFLLLIVGTIQQLIVLSYSKGSCRQGNITTIKQ